MPVLKNIEVDMLNKKGAETGDILGLAFFGFICIAIMLIAIYIIAPMMGDRAKSSVNEDIAIFNENLFLFNYLRMPVEDKTMADLVLESYIKKDYKKLESETENFLKELHSRETRVCCKTGSVFSWREREGCEGDVVSPELCLNWRIYINDESVVDHLFVSGNEKTIHETYIPNYYNLEPINFKFVFY